LILYKKNRKMTWKTTKRLYYKK